MIAVIGARDAGKSTYLAALFYQLWKAEVGGETWKVEIDARTREQCEDRFLQPLFQDMRELPATPMGMSAELRLVLENQRDRRRVLLVFRDLSGEVFHDPRRLGDVAFLRFAQGVVLLADPLAFQPLEVDRRRHWYHNEANCAEILDLYWKMLEAEPSYSAHDALPLLPRQQYLAIAVTKTDLFLDRNHSFWQIDKSAQHLQPGFWEQRRSESDEVAKWLEKRLGHRLTRAAEHFADVSYFFISNFGYAHEPHTAWLRKPPRPLRVHEPIFALLDRFSTASWREEADVRIADVIAAFSPGAPIDTRALFAGRTKQIQDIISATAQRGQHVVLFGERGVGKTSLANIVATIFRDPLQAVRVTAATDDSYHSIWSRAFRELNVLVPSRTIGFRPDDNCNYELQSLAGAVQQDCDPDDIRYLLQRLGLQFIIIIDELDRVRDEIVMTRMVDTIKTLSDHAIKTKLILVGVADSVDELIAEHASVERALQQVRMPRMSERELAEIIDKGLRRARMSIMPRAKGIIVRLSQGLPHYTHLLAQDAALQALRHKQGIITVEDLRAAVKTAVQKTQQSVLATYHRATRSSRRDSLFPQVLLACALAPCDALGYFAAAEIREPLSQIVGRDYSLPSFSHHLRKFCMPRRGPVLQRSGSERRYRYRFVNPLMQPFVIINAVSSGLIGEEMLLPVVKG